MTSFIFPTEQRVSVEIQGSTKQFPVNRVFCVGRNYAEHAREMGHDPSREAPFFFTKSPAALVSSGTEIPYPPGTSNFHHEIELVIAIGKAGFDITVECAHEYLFGYACGLDMTRRDLQSAAKEKGQPWSFGKDFENSAVIAPIKVANDAANPSEGKIWLKVNGEAKQSSNVSKMIWSIAEIVSYLSTYYCLTPGDLIYTGTPHGVGPVVRGDRIDGGIDGIGSISLSIAAS